MKNYRNFFKKQPFLITGTKADGNCPRYENCTRWDCSVWKPKDLPDQGIKNYSINSPRA